MVHCTHNHACLLIINLSEEEEKMLLNLVSHFRIVNFTVYLAMNKIFHCLNKTEMTTDHFKFTLKNIFTLFLFFLFLFRYIISFYFALIWMSSFRCPWLQQRSESSVNRKFDVSGYFFFLSLYWIILANWQNFIGIFLFWIHLFEEIAHNLWISTEKTANSLHKIQF